ncbi:MAG: tetratricopeptide repeat protein, partial [Bacteroidia bacterium]|nr:tetratricopeptide repeat protein [Bacteroidia bacterium]
MKFKFIIHFLCLSSWLIIISCIKNNDPKKTDPKPLANVYLNHSDSARYVGKQTCMLCHQNIYNTFIHTGMGKSLRWAVKGNSAAYFKSAHFYDSYSDFHYTATLLHDSIYIKEYRLDKKDTVFLMLKKIDYIVGSGQHTNSHLYNINGYLYQAPMTFYAQKKIWDLPPGFEKGHNTRFFRKIGLECITCHNAYPEFVNGSENKYLNIPTGIDCERCHGPGSIHVNKIRNNHITDTAKYIDYSIINPAKLPIERQFDICMRCHLQGNAVLVNNATFFDFKPGMKLNDFIQVFLPRFTDSKENFIMASHADRLKQSQCYIQSLKKINNKHSLKPYKNALTCITCHNPHISVIATKSEKFNSVCLSCHNPQNQNQQFCSSTQVKKNLSSDCVSCHMPVSGSKDIPHVTIHDHYIRIPNKEKSSTKTNHQFIGLVCINDSHPSKETKAKAYLYQYEKFDPFTYYLDSAEKILSIQNLNDAEKYLHTYIHLLFLQNKMNKIDELVSKIGLHRLLKKLSHKDLNNTDAWTSYRIGEAKYNINNIKEAELFFNNAVQLAPYVLEFRNKLAITQLQNNQINSAYKNWLWITKENPMFIQAFTNLGFLKLQQNQKDSAWYYLQKAYHLDPDNEMTLSNM